MDIITSNKIYHWLLVLLAVVTIVTGLSNEAEAQSSYELLPAPDVWYNSVDGVRVGGRLRGQQPGTFGEGAHRLNMGIWLGTKFPENPVSYYLSFTEPVPFISDFGSEANFRLETSFRTGFQSHGISFNKRWQRGFDELNYKKLSVGLHSEHRFDDDYLLYPQLWQSEWLYIASVHYVMTNKNAPGRYRLFVSTDMNIGGSHSSFVRTEISFQQKVTLSPLFTLSGRFYSGFASESTAPEYLFSHSLNSARSWMNRGLTRARGTIPPSWIEAGIIQVSGGPNLRGYLSKNISSLNNFEPPLYTSLSSLNMELDYPNPIEHAINKIPVLGEFVDLRSYAFYDVGTSLGATKVEDARTLSDAGLGFLFSINIPDYLGKQRGIELRYDIPFWLSHPGNEDSFEFRSVIGIGAVISL